MTEPGRHGSRGRGTQVVVGVTAWLLLGLAVTACSTEGASPPATAPTGGSTAGSTGTSASGGSGPCAWPTKADRDTLNVAYPDTAATYWTTSYVLAPGEHLELHGRFPSARYASFITYGPNGGAHGVLTDRDIAPDAGSTNPFRDGGAAGGRYTVEVRGDTLAGPNRLSATATTSTAVANDTAVPGSTPGTSAPPVVRDPRTLVGSGSPGGAGVVAGTVIYRVYLSRTAGDPTGGAGLPDMRLVHADGATADVPPCPHPGANPDAEAVVNANGPATTTAAPERPIFLRPKQNAQNLYPNPDNVYVVTILHHEPGRIAVVRAKAPTFPDTAHGATITGDEQVRYWSLCSDEYRKPYPVSTCVADQDVALDAGGSFTIVVSTPEDRPANATAANGVTWLDWGSTAVDNLLLLRHMLASPEFAESAINVAPGALATATMGPYAPRGAYCTTEAFARGGPAACPVS